MREREGGRGRKGGEKGGGKGEREKEREVWGTKRKRKCVCE